MIGRLAVVLLGVATVTLVTAGPVAAQAGKCASSKIKAACKKVSCKSSLEAKQASKGGTIDPAKVAKCEASFSKTFAKSEGKSGCVTTGDAATIETKVDAFVLDLDTELNVATGTDPNKCEGDKIKAAAKKASCKCALEAKQAQKGGTIDPAKVAKCEASFSKSFAKSEGKGGCNTTGDATTIEAKVDAFVADSATELDPGPTTTTTSTTTSTTVATTSTSTSTLPTLSTTTTTTASTTTSSTSASTTTTSTSTTSTTTTTIPCALDVDTCFGDCPPGMVCLNTVGTTCACVNEALDCTQREEPMCAAGLCEVVGENCVNDEIGGCECL